MYYITLDGARSAIELETSEDIVGLSRVLQLGYGVKIDRDKCELDCDNDEVREIIFGQLWDDSIADYYKKDIEYGTEVTIKVSLPGTDRWFDATGDDIMYARILINNAFGGKMTPENTQADIDDDDLQEVFKDLLSHADENSFKNFVWSAWKMKFDYRVNKESIDEAKNGLALYCKK